MRPPEPNLLLSYLVQYHCHDYYDRHDGEYAEHTPPHVLQVIYKIHWIYIHICHSLHKEIEYQTAGNDRGNLTGNIDAD